MTRGFHGAPLPDFLGVSASPSGDEEAVRVMSDAMSASGGRPGCSEGL